MIAVQEVDVVAVPDAAHERMIVDDLELIPSHVRYARGVAETHDRTGQDPEALVHVVLVAFFVQELHADAYPEKRLPGIYEAPQRAGQPAFFERRHRRAERAVAGKNRGR